MSSRMFPILCPWSRRERYKDLGIPSSVPWELLAPHESQTVRNHQQDLEKLAYRGGLDVTEMVAVLTDRTWPQIRQAKLSIEEAAQIVLAAIADHTKQRTE